MIEDLSLGVLTRVNTEARWPIGRSSEYGARGWAVRSSLRSPCCVLEQDTFTS